MNKIDPKIRPWLSLLDRSSAPLRDLRRSVVEDGAYIERGAATRRADRLAAERLGTKVVRARSHGLCAQTLIPLYGSHSVALTVVVIREGARR